MVNENMTVLVGVRYTKYASIQYVLDSIPFVSLVFFEDLSFQLLDTSSMPAIEFSPRLNECELNEFLNRNITIYKKFVSLINADYTAKFERCW